MLKPLDVVLLSINNSSWVICNLLVFFYNLWPFKVTEASNPRLQLLPQLFCSSQKKENSQLQLIYETIFIIGLLNLHNIKDKEERCMLYHPIKCNQVVKETAVFVLQRWRLSWQKQIVLLQNQCEVWRVVMLWTTVNSSIKATHTLREAPRRVLTYEHVFTMAVVWHLTLY